MNLASESLAKESKHKQNVQCELARQEQVSIARKRKKEKMLKNEVDYSSMLMHRIDAYDNLVKTLRLELLRGIVYQTVAWSIVRFAKARAAAYSKVQECKKGGVPNF